MSESERSPASRALDAIVAEAKSRDANMPCDWERLESRVMTAIEAEKPTLLREFERSSERSERSDDLRSVRAVRVGGVLLAAAAAALLYVRADHGVVQNDAAVATIANASASSLREIEGAGEARVGGLVVAPGAVLRSGDAIEVAATRAIFERPRKVTWLLEQRADGPVARARVKSAGEPLVLDLEEGAIEAQVVPVATGEAFAVDIATERSLVRVAVHGTHLRVSRDGHRVVVDLTEGVVSIGVPPRTGVTYGTLVTAPAHVELDATDLGTLQIRHDPAAIRSAIPLGGREPPMSALPSRTDEPTTPSMPAPSAPTLPSVGKPRPAPPKVDPGSATLAPRDAALAVVRECANARSRSGDVHVTVTSELRLRVSASGGVESAQFVPPLLPDVQNCAAQSLYRLHFDETGNVSVPIEFSY